MSAYEGSRRPDRQVCHASQSSGWLSFPCGQSKDADIAVKSAHVTASGYTNLELWLHDLATAEMGEDATPTSGPEPPAMSDRTN